MVVEDFLGTYHRLSFCLLVEVSRTNSRLCVVVSATDCAVLSKSGLIFLPYLGGIFFKSLPVLLFTFATSLCALLSFLAIFFILVSHGCGV